MALDLVDYEQKTRRAVRSFWGKRSAATQKQIASGKLDQGERTGVTAGNNMEGFVALLISIIKANGLPHADIYRNRVMLTLPGYFRATKLWDLLVIHKGELIASIELKSHIGPSFSNNFNNRAEEAIGTAHDLWTAYREDAFGKQPRPFVGWLMLVEDAEASRICQRLVKERLYTTATVITAPRASAKTGAFSELSPMTGLKPFVASLAGHVAAEAARLGR